MSPRSGGHRKAATVAGQSKGIQYWVIASMALAVLGSFGPWVKALGQSVSGVDGSNDGWLVIGAVLLGGLLFYATRTSRGAGLWALLGGGAGLAITIYDRSNVQNVIDSSGLASALVQVGWGLNVALAGSASLAVAGLVGLLQSGNAAPSAAPFAAPTSMPTAPPSALPPDPPPAAPTTAPVAPTTPPTI